MAPLLAQPDSRAAQALRWGLRGLRATLQAALDEAPQEPGGEHLRALLAELEPLLDPRKLQRFSASLREAEDGTRLPAATGPETDRLPATHLLPLIQALSRDQRFRAELDRSPLRDDDDEHVWNEIQRLLLRIPPGLAEEWRQRSGEYATQVGARVDQTAAVCLPLGRDEAIYPGLAGSIRAAGLRSSTAAPPDPRFPLDPGGKLHVLGGIATTCLWFVANDPHLCHCLKNVFRFGIRPVVGDQRERYVAELGRVWDRARTTIPGPEADVLRPRWKDHLKALLDLDEALHSLVHQPAAAADSWWGRFRDQTRSELFRAREQAIQAGCAVQIQVLGGAFTDVNRLAPDSLQVDFGAPGEVVACLRVWARVEGEELKGRVLYRSPQEEV
jgi:hypothetical protein